MWDKQTLKKIIIYPSKRNRSSNNYTVHNCRYYTYIAYELKAEVQIDGLIFEQLCQSQSQMGQGQGQRQGRFTSGGVDTQAK